MANYVDAGTQTRWAGLMQKEPVRPEALFSPHPDTSTPPDEMMVTEKVQFNHGRHDIATPERSPVHQHQEPTAATSPLLARRQNRPQFVAHIDLPSPVLAALDDATYDDMVLDNAPLDNALLNDEVPASPPTSTVVLSPVPEANKRFAGHTPLFPRSPSPQKFRKHPPALYPPTESDAVHDAQPAEEEMEQPFQHQNVVTLPNEDQEPTTPPHDVGLTGPLMLAPNPGDGAADHIALDVLDQELSKIAELQSREQSDNDQSDEDMDLGGAAQQKPSPQEPSQQARDTAGMPPPQSIGNSAMSSRKGSADSRRSEDVAPVDGVMLKRAPLNFGAPFGEA